MISPPCVVSRFTPFGQEVVKSMRSFEEDRLNRVYTLQHVADLPGRQRLRSASSVDGSFRTTVGDRALCCGGKNLQQSSVRSDVISEHCRHLNINVKLTFFHFHFRPCDISQVFPILVYSDCNALYLYTLNFWWWWWRSILLVLRGKVHPVSKDQNGYHVLTKRWQSPVEVNLHHAQNRPTA